MSSPEVRSAFLDRLKNSWEKAADYDVVDITNIHIDRGEDSSSWVAVEFPGGQEDQVSVGSPGDNLHRESGIVNIYILIESGQGANAELPALESIRNLFRAQRFADVECFAADPPSTTDKISPATIQGNWYILGTTIDYSFDRRG